MEIQEIEVTIDRDGKVSLHVRGVKGKKCLELTRPLEEALGGEVESRTLTHEAGETSRVEESGVEERRGFGKP